jgi:hypothetical protein
MQIEKKHLFAVVLASVFILPVAVFPKQSGEVLGINEVRDGSGQGSVGSIDAEGARDIASGARDVAKQEAEPETKSLFGKALWDSKQKVKVSTNKFSSGSSIDVTYNGKTTQLLVEGERDDLSAETVLILNTEAFVEIGANPETQSLADVEVSLAD